jgi:hypothetical protein
MTPDEKPRPDFWANGQAYRVTGQSVEPIAQGHAAEAEPTAVWQPATQDAADHGRARG